MATTKRKENDKILRIALLTISDRCFNGVTIDKSGPALSDAITKEDSFNAKVLTCALCPDEVNEIKPIINRWIDTEEVDVVFTIGGTGISPRDVTPEAVKEILDRELPGMAIAMITNSLRITPFAMLARPICGVKNKTLIITLPGSQKACLECFSFMAPTLAHAIDLIRDNKDEVEVTHIQIGGLKNIDKLSKVQMPNICNRRRKSPFPMISVNEALEIVLGQADESNSIKSQETYQNCLNSVIARDVFAKADIPPKPVSRMDGYAVTSFDGVGERTVLGSNTAGDENKKHVTPGCCMRISTGGVIPEGADAVVKVEDTELISQTEDKQEENVVLIKKKSIPGQSIRQIGTDIRKGDLVLKSGTSIGPSDIGVLVSSGNFTACVYAKPKIALISTGNELQDYNGQLLKEGRIFDSNRPTLKALLGKYVREIHDMGIAPDNATDLRNTLYSAFLKADIIITTGGVSMGEMDILKAVLETDFEAKILFGRVCMKPGKPTTFASCEFQKCKKFIFGLPGNPVSAVVAATLFVIPFCLKMSGIQNCCDTTIKVKLTTDIPLDDSRWEFRRVKLNWISNYPEAISTGIQESSRLMSLSGASALLKLPPRSHGGKLLKIGDTVEALLLDF